MKPNTIKFKKSESFYIRDGWYEKALNTIAENEEVNVFAKNNGIRMLGIGANMVKGLRYWLQASDIIVSSATKTEIGNLGKLILKWDRYFESPFTWFMIHFYLCTNYEECPVFYGTFNTDLKSFRKQDLVKYLEAVFSMDGFETKPEYIDEDVSVFLKSYIDDELINNPEDNYVCPLSSLKLLRKNGDRIEKVRPTYNSLSYLIVYYSLSVLYKFKEFKIEDSFEQIGSPYLIFNLDKNMYLQYLEEMRRNGLITINKTAGLNTVYFEKECKLPDIFRRYFGGDQ